MYRKEERKGYLNKLFFFWFSCGNIITYLKIWRFINFVGIFYVKLELNM